MRDLINNDHEIIDEVLTKLPLGVDKQFSGREEFITYICEKLGLH